MKNILFIFVFIMRINSGYSQVELFKDFNKIEQSSYPTTFIELNNLTYFVIKESANYFLYKTNGITGATELVNESPIGFPQFQQSSRNNLFLDNGYLFYITTRLSPAGIISEIWRTNESENKLIGALGDNYRILGFIDNLPVLSSADEIIKLGETGNSIVLLSEPSGESYNFRNHIPQKIGDELYFFTYVYTDFIKARFWKTNGSAAGTTLITEIDSLFNNNLQENINFRLTHKIGNSIYFFFERVLYQNTIVFNQELFKFNNGIVNKVKLLNSTNNSSNLKRIRNVTDLNAKLIFLTEGQNSQIWTSDGSASGTNIIKTLNTVIEKEGNFWGIADGKLFFNASETNDYQLWQTDGTSQNTVLFKILNNQASVLLSTFFNFPNGFIFKTNENKIWASDGTQTNTVVIGDFPIFYGDMGFDNTFNFSYNANLSEFHFNYFTDSTGFEPFKMNAKDKQIKLIKNINQSTKGFLSSTYRVKLDSDWYFSGTDNDSTRVIWRTDGTNEGTGALKTKGETFFVFGMTATTSKIFVNLRIDNPTGSMWRIGVVLPDSDSLKIVSIALQNEIPNFQPQNITSLDSRIIFNANGRSIWVSDGTAEGTFSLKTFNSFLGGFYSFNGRVYFMVEGSLWVTNGTILGTVQLTNRFNLKSPLTAFNHFTLNDKMYFFGIFNDETFLQKLGLFEFSAANLPLNVIDAFSNTFASNDLLLNFVSMLDGKAIFPLNNRFTDNKYLVDIWGFDGTNTRKITTIEGIRKGLNGINTFGAAILNNKHILFYSYLSSADGKPHAKILEISSDFSTLKTIFDIQTPLPFLTVSNFANRILFGLGIHETGTELWSTDGTSQGTYLLKDIFPGFRESHPANFMPFADKVLFSAYSPTVGAELYSYKIQSCEGNLNYTIKSGNWNDSSTWSCGRAPFLTEKALISSPHKINLSPMNIANSGTLVTELGSVLSFDSGSIFTSKP